MIVFGWASGEPMPLAADDLYATGVTVAAGIGPRVACRPGGIAALSAAALEELAAGRLHPLVHLPFALPTLRRPIAPSSPGRRSAR